MKKIFSILSILLLTFLIAACGASDEEATPNDNNSPSEDTTSNGATENEQEKDSTEVSGTTVKSENQEYSITILDGYELTAEEPNKDLLFNKENDVQSMRIEVYNASEVNMADITNNLVEILKASTSEGKVDEITEANLIPSGKLLEDVKAYEAEGTENKVYGYTFLQDGLGVRLTIFDTNESPALEDFVRMAETIKID